ncbi:MAG: hypothetical protein ACI9H8_000056 [Lysobacterales bacterium]|jgi:hypothetical protein
MGRIQFYSEKALQLSAAYDDGSLLSRILGLIVIH